MGKHLCFSFETGGIGATSNSQALVLLLGFRLMRTLIAAMRSSNKSAISSSISWDLKQNYYLSFINLKKKLNELFLKECGVPKIWTGSSIGFDRFSPLASCRCTFCWKIFLFHFTKHFIDIVSHHLVDLMWSFRVLKEVAASSALRSPLPIFIFQSPPFVLEILP